MEDPWRKPIGSHYLSLWASERLVDSDRASLTPPHATFSVAEVLEGEGVV